MAHPNQAPSPDELPPHIVHSLGVIGVAGFAELPDITLPEPRIVEKYPMYGNTRDATPWYYAEETTPLTELPAVTITQSDIHIAAWGGSEFYDDAADKAWRTLTTGVISNSLIPDRILGEVKFFSIGGERVIDAASLTLYVARLQLGRRKYGPAGFSLRKPYGLSELTIDIWKAVIHEKYGPWQ